MQVPLNAFVRWAIEHLGEARLVHMIRENIQRRAAPFSVDEYLDRNQVRGMYRNAIVGDKIVSVDDLVSCIRVLRLIISTDLRCPPWDRWPADSTVIIVLGERQVQIPDATKTMRQRAVGARDAEGMTHLAQLCQRRFQIECKVEPYLVPTDLPAEKAQKELERLCARKDVGAVVVLGSPVVNPLADPIARKMFGDDPEQLPARFRWSWAGQGNGWSDFLTEPGPCAPGEEGIRMRNHGKTTFPRIRDDEVLRRVRGGDHGPFEDCGILMMDCRQLPFLILGAGHGGCGTLACVHALADQAAIAERLAAAHDRLFGVIEVRRKKLKHSPDNVDDLFIDDQGFAW